jgi:hypothetical protein
MTPIIATDVKQRREGRTRPQPGRPAPAQPGIQLAANGEWNHRSVLPLWATHAPRTATCGCAVGAPAQGETGYRDDADAPQEGHEALARDAGRQSAPPRGPLPRAIKPGAAAAGNAAR